MSTADILISQYGPLLTIAQLAGILNRLYRRIEDFPCAAKIPSLRRSTEPESASGGASIFQPPRLRRSSRLRDGKRSLFASRQRPARASAVQP